VLRKRHQNCCATLFQDPGVHHAPVPALGHDRLQLVRRPLQPVHQHQGDPAEAASHPESPARNTRRRPGQTDSHQKGEYIYPVILSKKLALFSYIFCKWVTYAKIPGKWVGRNLAKSMDRLLPQ